MGIMVIGIVSIFIVIASAMYAILKILNSQKLFFSAVLSFTIFTSAFVGAAYFFFPELQLATKAQELGKELFPEETPFVVMINNEMHFYSSFAEAVFVAKDLNTVVFFRDIDTIAWEQKNELPPAVLNAPLLLQLPDLPRGAAIASLAMLLRYAGEKVDKMELATNVKKDPTPLSIDENQQIHWGNPNDGFVGELFFFNSPGYGVYHKPIMDLASTYLPGKMMDMTGGDFEDILHPIHAGSPVWVIIHTQFKTLPPSSFQTWLTPTGEVEVTYYQHSVLITGYDDQAIYYNDPLSLEVNRPMEKQRFKEAWEQMGKQAITFLH